MKVASAIVQRILIDMRSSPQSLSWSRPLLAGAVNLSLQPPRPPSPSSTSPSSACNWLPLHPTFCAQPEEYADASDHDLANFSTNVRLVEAYTAKKSMRETRVCTEASPAACGEDPCSPWDPPVVGDPRPSSGVRWPTDCTCLLTPWTILLLDGGSPALKGVKVKAAVASCPSLAHGRSQEPKSTKENSRGISVRTFLACISTRLRYSSLRTRLTSAATCSAMASPYSRGNYFACACSAQEKRESGQSHKKSLSTRGASSTLRKIFKDKQACSHQEKVISKIFQPRQPIHRLIGFLSLDLLRFHLGPFWTSTTRAMKEGISLG
ncbi:hypothetical protein Cgig2_019736 [Carnegiea gigantea]|uniref:Uncharacterized protein n=1 Tax=Carnegiea gigantea TaxID=171969 RepID=A0A9Q1KPM7_9CARY|nr:hypothetical protein Cgig2_019736 [Carnegiea gigantea]